MTGEVKPLEREPGAERTPMPVGGKSVAERVFMVLLAFDPRHRTMTQSEIARRTGLPVATVHRMLRRLEDMGALERNSEGRYGIGPLMWRMGILAPTHDVIGRGARPLLMSLSARTSSDVRVLCYFDEAAMCVDEIHVASMSADSGLGEMHRLHGSAGGVAVAAQLPPESRRRLRLTGQAYQRLERSIALAEERRHVVLDHGGSVELAVPLEVRDRPPMSLQIRFAVETRTPATTARRLPLLQETARALSVILNERSKS
jgi:DNA-binding IclR family transcriptional regulator